MCTDVMYFALINLIKVNMKYNHEHKILLINSDIDEHDQLFDDGEFKSPAFQRPFQYMYRLDTKRVLSDIDVNRIEGTPLICLQTMLR